MYLNEIRDAARKRAERAREEASGEAEHQTATDDSPPLTQMPEIMNLFAYRPEMTDHLCRFTQEVMRGPSELSPGQRELIAAFTSDRNGCPF